MTTGIGPKAVLAAAVLVSTVLAGSSCAIDPNRVPLPGTSIGDGYDLTLEFTSAMNLPDRANVMMDGLRIGQVLSTQLTGSAVRVRARIAADTRIPEDTTAIIRQDTVLGDTYVGLEHGHDAAPTGYLSADAVIPATHTTAPPQLEDVMAVLANFINGGSIQKVQNTLIGVNKVMPAPPDVSRMASTVSTDLQDLAAQNSEIDRLLAQLNATAESVDASGPQLSAMLSDPAVHYWFRINDGVLKYVGTLLPSIGTIFQGGQWLIPLLESLASGVTAARSTAENVPADLTAMSGFLNGTLLPFLRNPSVNVDSVRTRDGGDITPAFADILRILGVLR
ncbi:MlaD family protein [Nocardia sp. NPDC004123]